MYKENAELLCPVDRMTRRCENHKNKRPLNCPLRGRVTGGSRVQNLSSSTVLIEELPEDVARIIEQLGLIKATRPR